MEKYEEHRKYKRYTIKCNAECCNEQVNIININKEGMRIKSQFSIHSNECINFHVELSDLETVTIIGSILWEKNPEYNTYFYGIKIKSITGDKKRTFEYYLNEIEKYK